MEKYQILKPIGKGSYGDVFLVRHTGDRKQYVLKKIFIKKSLKEKVLAQQEVLFCIFLSILICYRLSYYQSYIIQVNLYLISLTSTHLSFNHLVLLKLLTDIVEYKESFLTDKGQYMCIVMAFCEGGDLFTRLKAQNKKYLSEKVTFHIA